MADRLELYRAKRDAGQTEEPPGRSGVRTSLRSRPQEPRFVIQKHAASSLHYDLGVATSGRRFWLAGVLAV